MRDETSLPSKRLGGCVLCWLSVTVSTPALSGWKSGSTPQLTHFGEFMNTFQLEQQVYGVGFIDGAGEPHWQLISSSNDTIWFCAVTDGRHVHFESEARHLPAWCKEHGFKYYRGQTIVTMIMRESS